MTTGFHSHSFSKKQNVLKVIQSLYVHSFLDCRLYPSINLVAAPFNGPFLFLERYFCIILVQNRPHKCSFWFYEYWWIQLFNAQLNLYFNYIWHNKRKCTGWINKDQHINASKLETTKGLTNMCLVYVRRNINFFLLTWHICGIMNLKKQIHKRQTFLQKLRGYKNR